MAESGARAGARAVAVLAGVAAVGVATWWLLDARPADDASRAPARPAAQPQAPPSEGSSSASQPAPDPARRDGPPRIASRGRLRLDAEALPDEGPLVLDLALEDAVRGAGERAVRLFSQDGRRLELAARPLPEPGSGVRLEIEPAFLEPGRYMIEVETEADPRAERIDPLPLRRYVLEIR